MNAISFTTGANPEWDKKIASGLRKERATLTGRGEEFKTHNFYVSSGDNFAGGVRIEQHGDILWVDALRVEPRFRKQGLGKSLIQQAFLFATQNKLTEVQLNTYFETAHKFFLRCDFEDVAVISNWKYGLTCYLMRKKTAT